METVSIKNFPREIKEQILKELGYMPDGAYILDPEGNRVKDKYIDQEVNIANMVILPGSTIILDDNPLSIASYMEEYGNVL